MDKIKLQVKRLAGADDMPLPQYMTPHAAGMDIFAAVEHELVLNPGERTLIPTGIAIALPPGFEAQIRPRSGMAINYGICILNAPGTIDADYRGEVKVIVANLGKEPVSIKRGDRIAQMVINRVIQGEWAVVEELPQSERNDGGFGHTGK